MDDYRQVVFLGQRQLCGKQRCLTGTVGLFYIEVEPAFAYSNRFCAAELKIKRIDITGPMLLHEHRMEAVGGVEASIAPADPLQLAPGLPGHCGNNQRYYASGLGAMIGGVAVRIEARIIEVAVGVNYFHAHASSVGGCLCCSYRIGRMVISSFTLSVAQVSSLLAHCCGSAIYIDNAGESEMKVVSFNTNGIRAREHQLEALVRRYDPDIIAIQESKVQDEEFPVAAVEALGYRAHFFGQKSHYGVALLSRQEPLSVLKGYANDADDAQRRMISAVYRGASGDLVTVVNGYFPQGESRDHAVKFPAKEKFYNDLMAYLDSSFAPDENLLVVGDMNIAPVDLDIGIGEDNAKRWLRTGKCSFLPEERAWMARLIGWGLEDTFRSLRPDAGNCFSWFDYRSRGFEREPKRGLRIDLILATPALNRRCKDVGIAYDIRAMERPSDHCPVWAEFDL